MYYVVYTTNAHYEVDKYYFAILTFAGFYLVEQLHVI
jgi:hypothetical protein